MIHPFALFSTVGTANNEALIPVAQKAGLPMLTLYTGAPSIRASSAKGVLNLRASDADEIGRLVNHLATVGIRRIAIAYQNNGFGKEVLAAANDSLERRRLKAVMAVPVETNASDASAAKDRLLASDPEAVLLALAGKPTIEVSKGIAQRRRGMQIYALSVLATAANLKALGADSTGVTISQVVPFPNRSQLPVVREYRQVMTGAGHTDFSHLISDGYFDAKLVTEGLRRAGRGAARHKPAWSAPKTACATTTWEAWKCLAVTAPPMAPVLWN